MSRLIDADEFIKEMKELYKQAGWEDRDIHFSLADVISNIDMMPTYFIIQCKDCKYFTPMSIYGHGLCDIHCNGVGEPEVVSETYYCAWADRR